MPVRENAMLIAYNQNKICRPCVLSNERLKIMSNGNETIIHESDIGCSAQFFAAWYFVVMSLVKHPASTGNDANQSIIKEITIILQSNMAI
jgi:hypothetical protein